MEEEKKSRFTVKTDQELKQIAADIYENKIFTDRHVKGTDTHILGSIFMPALLGAFNDWTEEETKQIGLVYEYNSEAGPRGVNGYPCFLSLRILSSEQADKVDEYYLEYKTLKEKFVGKEETT